MTAQPYQRREPQPWGRAGEVAFVAASGVLVLLAAAALAGVGVSGVLFGRGWVWPHGGSSTAAAIGGLLAGHPGAGLPAGPAGSLPGRDVVYGCVAAAELLALGLLLAAVAGWLGYRRPGDARGGMATRREAAQVLGLRRLRDAGPVIRPDRYGPRGGPR